MQKDTKSNEPPRRAKSGERSVHLTQDIVRDLPLPTKAHGSRIHMDDAVPGFCCQVSYAGTKTFRLRYRKAGAWQSVKIGRWRDGTERKQPGKVEPTNRSALTAAEARREAEALRAELDKGANPAVDRKIKAAAQAEQAAGLVLVRDAYARYREALGKRRKPLRPGSIIQIESAYDNHILPALGDRYVSTLVAEDIRALVAVVSKPRMIKGRKHGGRIIANRVVAHLSTFLTWCTKQSPALAAANVVKLIDRGEVLAPEVKRRRYLSADEWAAVMLALDEWPLEAKRGSRYAATKTVRLDKPQVRQLVSCEALRVALLTGARKGEVLAMRWRDIDLERGWWEKPAETMKSGNAHAVALPAMAIDALRRVRAAHGDRLWVFPGKERLDTLGQGKRLRDDDGGPTQDVHELWGRIRRKIGIPDVRIHDLRHTAASVLISSGATLYEVGEQLGHSQAQTTMRYSHLFDAAKRANANRMDAFAASMQPESGTAG